MSNYMPPKLPLSVDLESKVVLKQVAAAHRRLAELKGLVIDGNGRTDRIINILYLV